MSTMRQWLLDREYNPDAGLCISIGTDGLNAERNNILAISYAGCGHCPSTIFIEGADAGAVMKYTGVHPTDYSEFAVGLPRAKELLEEVFADAEFFVTYSAMNFQRKWVQRYAADLGIGDYADLEFVDVVNVVKCYEQGHPLGEHAEDLETLEASLDNSFFHIKGGFSFEAICDRCGIQKGGGSTLLEDKISKLWALYVQLLDRVST